MTTRLNCLKGPLFQRVYLHHYKGMGGEKKSIWVWNMQGSQVGLNTNFISLLCRAPTFPTSPIFVKLVGPAWSCLMSMEMLPMQANDKQTRPGRCVRLSLWIDLVFGCCSLLGGAGLLTPPNLILTPPRSIDTTQLKLNGQTTIAIFIFLSLHHNQLLIISRPLDDLCIYI